MNTPGPSALIAEDEPMLGASLEAELVRLWPELRIVANVRHGAAAVEQALALTPDVVFLDIRMPGLSGIEAAAALSEDWQEGVPLPLMVFVTAYDQYALQAFEHAAIDYLLKPVQSERLAKSCARLKAALAARAAAPQSASQELETTLRQLRGLLEAGPAAGQPVPALKVIQASVGQTIHLVPVAEVLYFEAADKNIRVVTGGREYLIRLSLRQLLPQLDTQLFWQVHRGTVVRVDAIASALRDESGKVQLRLRGRAETLDVSRLYARLFKPM
jgi:DNA-binding LytR/AlgR family response regulator